ETLFNRLRGQFDFIIVDCCPVLPVADALLIGQHVDGVLFSIMQDVSQLPKIVTASEKLAQLNIPLVGAVVNGTRQSTYSYAYNSVKHLPACPGERPGVSRPSPIPLGPLTRGRSPQTEHAANPESRPCSARS